MNVLRFMWAMRKEILAELTAGENPHLTLSRVFRKHTEKFIATAELINGKPMDPEVLESLEKGSA